MCNTCVHRTVRTCCITGTVLPSVKVIAETHLDEATRIRPAATALSHPTVRALVDETEPWSSASSTSDCWTEMDSRVCDGWLESVRVENGGNGILSLPSSGFSIREPNLWLGT